jgi:hypothetical protein
MNYDEEWKERRSGGTDDKGEERTIGRGRRIKEMEDWNRLTDERKEGSKMMKDEKDKRTGRG